jgi:D-xylose transport system substrate-binding protein
MRKRLFALVAVGLLATASLTACTDDGDGDSAASGGSSNVGGGGKGKVGVIMPDSTTAQRWKSDDPRYLKAAFEAAGVPVDIQNAEGDKVRFQAIADQMISSGVKVLIIVNLDSPSAKAVLDKAKAAKVKTIDYDRLTLNGGADYYVSFDNQQVGRLQGRGLVDCLKAKGAVNPVVAELNGSPTDNNATLFKKGYDEVLQPKYDSAEYTKGPDQSVPDWVNKEGGKIFEQMFAQQPRIRGVLAANDGLGNAVIEVLRKHKLAGQVPVTGQDATVQGLQNILTGDQCMTIYKAIKPEADAAADLAVALYNNQPPPARLKIDRLKDPESGAYVPFVKLEPKAITKATVKDVIADGFVSKADVCKKKFADLCEENGIK